MTAGNQPYVKPFRFLSLGAGVQSTTIYLLAIHGEIEPIDLAVFADTQWERGATYRHLEWLESTFGDRLPIQRVTRGDVRSKWWQMPLYTDAGIPGEKEGRISRNCSREFKVAAVRSVVRPIYLRQPAPRRPLVQLMGFSLDEHERASDSPVRYLKNDWPLLYDRPMTKGDCLAWLTEHGYTEPPKSACIGCPMRSDDAWLELEPDEFAEAAALDTAMRVELASDGPDRPAFLHRRGALTAVTLRAKPDRGDQLGLGIGMCDSGAGCFT